jgi:hypothetical protein
VKQSSTRIIIGACLAILVMMVAWQIATWHSRREASLKAPGAITIDYPIEGSIFPPEFPAPTWLWRDAEDEVTFWDIDIAFSDGASPIRIKSSGEPMHIGESDPRAVSATNKPPALTQEQAAAHTWIPDAATWSAIKAHSVEHSATVVITGHRRGDPNTIASRGQVTIRTSKDPDCLEAAQCGR